MSLRSYSLKVMENTCRRLEAKLRGAEEDLLAIKDKWLAEEARAAELKAMRDAWHREYEAVQDSRLRERARLAEVDAQRQALIRTLTNTTDLLEHEYGRAEALKHSLKVAQGRCRIAVEALGDIGRGKAVPLWAKIRCASTLAAIAATGDKRQDPHWPEED